MSFSELQVRPEILKSLAEQGIETPTEIQRTAIPLALQGKNVVACSETGSGKTIAFCLPILQKLSENPDAHALVLCPTREIAEQITKVVQGLIRFYPEKEKRGMAPVCVIGGAAMGPQVRLLRYRPRWIVATPGRLNDHIGQGTVSLDKVAYLVLDECDRMLDMGFAPQIRQILRKVPTSRQSLLFSATVDPQVEATLKEVCGSAVRVGAQRTHKPPVQIEQSVVETTAAEKGNKLVDIILEKAQPTIVFTRTKHRTDKLAKFLIEYGFRTERIHGGRSQRQRREAIEFFKQGRSKILVATDIAARGIDIPDVGLVVNFDLPQCAEDFIHRMGRTGRAGAAGQSLSLITPEDRGAWRGIERALNPGKSGASAGGGARPRSGGYGQGPRPSAGGPRGKADGRRPGGWGNGGGNGKKTWFQKKRSTASAHPSAR